MKANRNPRQRPNTSANPEAHAAPVAEGVQNEAEPIMIPPQAATRELAVPSEYSEPQELDENWDWGPAEPDDWEGPTIETRERPEELDVPDFLKPLVVEESGRAPARGGIEGLVAQAEERRRKQENAAQAVAAAFEPEAQAPLPAPAATATSRTRVMVPGVSHPVAITAVTGARNPEEYTSSQTETTIPSAIPPQVPARPPIRISMTNLYRQPASPTSVEAAQPSVSEEADGEIELSESMLDGLFSNATDSETRQSVGKRLLSKLRRKSREGSAETTTEAPEQESEVETTAQIPMVAEPPVSAAMPEGGRHARKSDTMRKIRIFSGWLALGALVTTGLAMAETSYDAGKAAPKHAVSGSRTPGTSPKPTTSATPKPVQAPTPTPTQETPIHVGHKPEAVDGGNGSQQEAHHAPITHDVGRYTETIAHDTDSSPVTVTMNLSHRGGSVWGATEQALTDAGVQHTDEDVARIVSQLFKEAHKDESAAPNIVYQGTTVDFTFSQANGGTQLTGAQLHLAS